VPIIKFRTALVALSCSCALAQQYSISTVAGGAPPPTPATALGTSLGQPRNVTLDSAGNLYFSSGNAVFKQSASGTVTVFAGNSRAGYSGDGGLALNAQFNQAAGIAVDAGGNVYISDSMNNVVRKVTTDGVINTIAGNGTPSYTGDGGAATQATLHNPLGLVLDKKGNLYIADNFNHAVREVTPDGNINTFAGNYILSFGFTGDGGPATAAQLTYPTDVAIDSSGNIYIADYGNFMIRQVTTDGIIHSYAGTNVNGFSGDGGNATSGLSSNPAELFEPFGVALDSSRNLYITEYGDSRIRKVAAGTGTANGNLSTIAGNGTAGFAGDGSAATKAELNVPRGICIDSSGNIYVADWANNRLRKIGSDGNINTITGNGILSYSGDGGTATKAQLNTPGGVAIDAAGNIYIADTGNNVVRQVTKGVISTFAGTGTAGFAGDGSAANKAQLSGPQGVAVDSAGNVYIADSGNFRVRVVATNGNISTFAGSGSQGYAGDGGAATAAKFYLPGAVTTDKAGNVYIADFQGCVVRKVVASGTISTVAGTGGCGYGGDGGPATAALLNEPAGIGLDPSGNLYITQLGDNRVRMVSTNGIITTIAGNGADGYTGESVPALSSKLAAPNGVVADASGNVYISMAGNRVMQVAAGGILATVAGTGAPGYTGDGGPAASALFNAPSGIALDSAGNFYIADASNNAIRMLVFSGYGNSVSSVVNGASGAKGAIAPGEIVVIYGSNLGPQLLTPEQVVNNVVTTVLAGTRVLFNGTPAPVLYTWATQVSAVVPFGLTGSTAQVAVQYGNQTSPPVPVPVVPVSPALFSADSSGQGQAMATNADGTNNGASNPAAVGSVIALFATGLGPMSPATPDGTITFPPLPNTALPVGVTIGGKQAIAHSATGVPSGVAGSVMIYVEVPAGVSGSAVPVVIQAGGVSSPSGVTIAVAGS
jgi:uncharacterized protein (TIGR03437 family)